MDIFKLSKDLLIKISTELEPNNLLTWFQTCKQINSLTNNNNIFWMNKLYKDFVPKTNTKTNNTTKTNTKQIEKPEESWKQFYNKILTSDFTDLLWEGVKNNQKNLVIISLFRGADINSIIKDNGSYTPLAYSVFKGYSNMFNLLLKYNADIHIMDDGILVVASSSGNLKTIKMLVKLGCDIKNSSLPAASENGHLEVVKYLVGQGADVRADYDSALRLASSDGHLEVVKYLVERGANVRAEDDDALGFASQNGHLEVVKYLVEQGANVRAFDDYALRYASYFKHLEVVKYLVEQGADVSSLNDSTLKGAKQINIKRW